MGNVDEPETDQSPADRDHALDLLAHRAAAGDRTAFGTLVDQTAHPLRMFVTARLRSRTLIEEILQDTYVLAWERLTTYRGPGCFQAWLMGIAHNRIRVELRDDRRRRAVDQYDLALLIEAPAPEDELGAEVDLAPHLAACLEHLEPRARLLLQRRYSEDVPLSELAQAFKRNVKNLTMTLHRLRVALRLCIQSRTGT